MSLTFIGFASPSLDYFTKRRVSMPKACTLIAYVRLFTRSSMLILAGCAENYISLNC